MSSNLPPDIPVPPGPGDANGGVCVAGPRLGCGAICGEILRALPEWFGIPAAVVEYEQAVGHLPTLLAEAAGRAVGFLSIKQHNAYAAEHYVLGVLPDWHRQGIGRALIARAEDLMRAAGVEYMQVKTLGPSHSDPYYARTRAFYTALGYRPLEEFTTIWDERNPCLILVKAL
ncbi:MAG: GNAT family N-acetyltransferase [Anaerolineae bacterium]|nr:GNAT family N-acetyltransferase [Anaerolineae bacterium]